MSASVSRQRRRSFAWLRWPLTWLGLIAVGSVSEAQGTPATHGQWSGPYSWPYVIAPPSSQLQSKEISHAALIPTGAHAGKVLLFSWQGRGYPNTDVVWFFNPDAPSDLSQLTQGLGSNIFCSATTWDAAGLLLVAGGTEAGAAATKKAYKLDPFRLGPIAYPIGGGVGIMAVDVNVPPWRSLADMTLARFYPTAIPIWRKPISFTNTSIPAIAAGGSNLAFGGPIYFGVCLADGNEAFEFLPYRATAWRAPALPPPAAIIHTNELPGSLTRETYSLHGTPLPSVALDSYPRAVQMSNGQVYVAGDVDTLMQGLADPNQSWVFKLFDPVLGVPDFQLHRGKPDVERYYGTMWLMHFRPSYGDVDRLFYAGGSTNLTTPSSSGATCNPPSTDPVWDGNALKSVMELQKDAPALEHRTWLAMKALNEKRVFINAVILPTGQVLIMGGSRTDYHRPYMNTAPSGILECPDPVYAPELYDVGPDPGILTTQPAPILLAQPSPMSGYTLPTPRLYHHVTVLLRDGRVFVAGGEVPDYGHPSPCGPTAPNFSPSQYTGEIYSPPYLFKSYRPNFTATPPNLVALSPDGGAVQQFSVDVQIQPGNAIVGVTLLRPAAITHHFDNDQRFIELAFSGMVQPDGTATLTVDSPRESLAPSGYYLLFVNEAPSTSSPRIDWAPSTGHFVRFH